MITESFYLTLKPLKSRDKISLLCDNCSSSFITTKKNAFLALNYNKTNFMFCSHKCSTIFNNNNLGKTSTITTCGFCNKEIVISSSVIKKSKSGKVFCSQSCSCSYNNEHKIVGTRRSKLETWLEQQLVLLYPALQIDFNKKETINSELDIYIPSLKLAFELNGLFHYEPIFGKDKLKSIQTNDQRKFQACLEQGIEFCIIDSSRQKHFTEQSSQKYLDIICQIINIKINGSGG